MWKICFGVGVALVLGSCAPTATVSTPIGSFQVPVAVPRQEARPNVFPANYDASAECATVNLGSRGDLTYIVPARYPNPSQLQEQAGSYTLVCPSFRVESDAGKRLYIRAASVPDALKLFRKAESDTGPLRLDYTFWVSLEDVGKVSLHSSAINSSISTNFIIAVKQAESPAQVALFDGASQTVSYDPQAPVDIYFIGDSRFQDWQRVTVDQTTGELTFYAKATAPAR